MKTYLSILKQISTIIIISFFIFTLSCSDDPSSPKKEDDNPTPQETVTIGVEGGIVEKGDFKITIPAGAFNGNYDISVAEIEDDGAFGENTISGSFKIKGLPNSYSEPIKIKVKFIAELSGNSFLAVGNDVFDEVNSDSSFEYQLFEASDSAGFLIGKIPGINLGVIEKSTSELNESNSSIDRIIKVISAYREKRSENFVFHYPIVLESFMVNVEKTFEDVFNIISRDLDLSFYPKPKHQTVIIKYFQSEKAVFGYPKGFGKDQQYFFVANISHILQNDFDGIKKSLGNVILNLELIYYKNLGEFKKTIESWAEELFTDGEFKYPTNFEQNITESFKGLKNYGSNVEGHSIGLAVILKYLAEDEELFGMKGLKKMHSNISKDVDPISALLKTVDGNVVDWLPDFTQKYLMGEIYDLPQSSFFDYVPLEWNVNSNTDTLKEFNYFPANYYRDISAKLFKINLNHQPEDDTYNMLFDMRGNTEFGLSLVVFGIKNNELTYLETAHAQDFIIPNLKEYYDNNIRQFLAVLVNTLGVPPYDGNSEVDLIIQIGNNLEGGGGNGKYDFNFCELQLLVNKTYKREDGSTFEQETIQALSAEGEMIGNRFVTKREFSVFADTLEVELSEDGNSIVLLDWTSWYIDESLPTTHKTVIEAVGIPIYDSADGIFKVSGLQTCGNVTHYSYDQNFQGNETTVTSINCNENSFLEVRLYKRE